MNNPEPRVCRADGCETILCRSNSGPLCYAHTPTGSGRVVYVGGVWKRINALPTEDDSFEDFRELMGEYE